jgi:drug/metabolite transporter (DMT)-like permease
VVLIGLLFALASAVASNVGFLLRHKGAVAAPDVDVRRPLRTVIDLFKSKWWTIGYIVAAVAWGLHVASLGLAPLSIVQAVLASGIVILGVIAERFFGFELGRRQWVGIGLTGVGLAALSVTAATEGTSSSHAHYGIVAAIVFEGALIALGALLLMSHRVERISGSHGVLLGVGAALLFTVSHVGIKALTNQISLSDPLTLLNPWVLVVVLAFVGAFFASARSLQIGPAVPVIAVTSAIGNVSAILAGVVVFSDPLGSTPAVVALRIGAFALVVIAAALIPAPTRAAKAASEGSGAKQGSDRSRAATGRSALGGAG